MSRCATINARTPKPMRLLTLSMLLLCVAAVTPQADAAVATLGQSSQTVTFTGLGGTPSGQGQSRVSWGSCAFDGTRTKCTVSGPYTGLGEGGTYALLLDYPGNGQSPLNAVSSVPGGDLIFFQLSAGSFVITLTPNGGAPFTLYDPATFRFTFVSNTCTNVSTCTVGQEGLTPGATLTGLITGIFDPAPVIRTSPPGVISASEYGAFSAIAPGSWIEIYGSNLGTTLGRVWGGSDFTGDQAPTSLAGTSVTVGGKAAFVNFVSPGQINVQVPSGVATGSQPVIVTTAGGISLASNVTVNPVQPGLLAPSVFKLAAGQYAVALLPDGRTFILPAGTTTAVPTARAKPGDVIMLYGVGFGPVTPDIPAGQIVRPANTLQSKFQASFAGVPADVQFAGLVNGFVGLYQFNVVVPQVATSNAVPVTFTLGGTSGTQTLLIAIQN